MATDAASSKTMLVPAYPSNEDIARSRRRHFLFGYPIAHSASPAFQNAVIQFNEQRRTKKESVASSVSSSSSTSSSATAALSPCNTGVPTYSLCETKSIDEAHFYALVRHDPHHGGSGVTMPLKVAVTAKLGRDQILDELDSIGKATSTVNTIVVLPSLNGDVSLANRRTIGTNTDCLGIRHALLRDIAMQTSLPAGSLIGSSAAQGGAYVFPQQRPDKPYSAFIIGSGGTCRSAVWALHNLGLSPLYLLNRDEQETQDVVDHFASLQIDLRPLHSIEAFAREQGLRQQGIVGDVVCAVGAIPAFEPVTDGEKMVYTLAHAFFNEPYTALASVEAGAQASVPSNSNSSDDGDAKASFRTFALPAKRSFLDMCYKPRLTPLLQYAATQTSTWSPIGGVEAMVEQGLAQARMWAASSDILSGKAAVTEDPLKCATTVGDQGPLGAQCEEEARKMVQAMSDVVVAPANLCIPSFASSVMANAGSSSNATAAVAAAKSLPPQKMANEFANISAAKIAAAVQAQSVH